MEIKPVFGNKMKLTKENVCVFIESEAHLEEARQLLEKHGEIITISDYDFQYLEEEDNYLCLDGDWWVVCDDKYPDETQINLTELEQILIEERK